MRKLTTLARLCGLNKVFKHRDTIFFEYSSVIQLVIEHSLECNDTRLLERILTLPDYDLLGKTIPVYSFEDSRLIHDKKVSFCDPWLYINDAIRKKPLCPKLRNIKTAIKNAMISHVG